METTKSQGRFVLPQSTRSQNTSWQTPGQVPTRKSPRAQVKADRAVIAHEVKTLRRPDATPQERATAEDTIASRILKPLKLRADHEGRKLLATLADGLIANGTIGLFGIGPAIESVAATKGVTKDQLDTLSPAIVERLDKLV